MAVVTLALWLSSGGCAPSPAAPPGPPPPAPAPAEVAVRPEEIELTLLAVGDVLPHRRVKQTAAELGWAEVLGDVGPLAQQADLAFANLESPVAPDHHQGVHGEVFDAPPAMLEGLAAAGFDVLSMANNHVYDQGPAGLVETWTRVRAAGMTPIGAGPDCATARGAEVREVRGLRIAFLAAVDLLNFDLVGADDAPCVFVAGPVCTGDCGPDRDAVHFSLDEARLVSAVRAARARADLVVMSFHWGDEYRVQPLPEYPRLARILADAGVDVLLGHHPHVLQPVETLRASDGRDVVVAYSLGNLVSNMAERFVPETDPPARARTRDTVALQLRVRGRPGEGAAVVAVRAVPLWTDNRSDGVRVRTHDALLERGDRALVAQRRAEIEPIVSASLLGPAPVTLPPR